VLHFDKKILILQQCCILSLSKQLKTMLKRTFFQLLSLVFIVVAAVSCGDDELENPITITFENPINGAVLTTCTPVPIDIHIESEEELHDIEISLHAEGDSTAIIDYDGHSHETSLHFSQNVDLCSYAAGTCFDLEVQVAKEHDGTEKEIQAIRFCLQ
jgi:hypothetical protein